MPVWAAFLAVAAASGAVWILAHVQQVRIVKEREKLLARLAKVVERG